MILSAPTPSFQPLSVHCLQPRVVCGCQLGPRAGNRYPLPYGRCSSPVTRRFILAAGSSIATTAAALGLICSGAMAMAASGGGRADREGAYKATRRGMQLFVEGDVEGSVVEFDKAMELDPSQKPYLWQRGLSLYYANRFEEGARQFRDDVAVNPNDTEEAIWAFLCEAQLSSAKEARNNFLQVGQDPRPVMRAAYELFQRGGNPDELVSVGAGDNGGHDSFYSLLYTGLFYEAMKDCLKAETAMTAAVKTAYGSRNEEMTALSAFDCRGLEHKNEYPDRVLFWGWWTRSSGDYMARLAKVHCKLRGWAA